MHVEVPRQFIDRSSLPSLGTSQVGTTFRWPSGTTKLSDLCWGIILRPFGSRDFRLRGPQQISLGKTKKIRNHLVANTHMALKEIGFRS